MGKVIALVLPALVLIFIGIGGYFLLIKNKAPSKQLETVKLVQPSGNLMKNLLTDVGWESVESVKLLSGESVATKDIKRISAEYSPVEQKYLKQGDGNGKVFASLDTLQLPGEIKFVVHVAPEGIASKGV